MKRIRYNEDFMEYVRWGFWHSGYFFDYCELIEELNKEELHSAIYGYWYCNIQKDNESC